MSRPISRNIEKPFTLPDIKGSALITSPKSKFPNQQFITIDEEDNSRNHSRFPPQTLPQIYLTGILSPTSNIKLQNHLKATASTKGQSKGHLRASASLKKFINGVIDEKQQLHRDHSHGMIGHERSQTDHQM